MDKRTGKRLKMLNIFATVLVALLIAYIGYYVYDIQINYILILEAVVIIMGISYNMILSNKIQS